MKRNAMKTTIITQRPSDSMAHLEGRPEKWESAKTALEAIGRLIVTYAKTEPETLGIVLKDME